jgi:hypothetical protein
MLVFAVFTVTFATCVALLWLWLLLLHMLRKPQPEPRVFRPPTDGNCLYACLAVIHGNHLSPGKMRETVCQYHQENNDAFGIYFDDGEQERHLEKQRKNGVWGSDIDVFVFSQWLGKRIPVINVKRDPSCFDTFDLTDAQVEFVKSQQYSYIGESSVYVPFVLVCVDQEHFNLVYLS